MISKFPISLCYQLENQKLRPVAVAGGIFQKFCVVPAAVVDKRKTCQVLLGLGLLIFALTCNKTSFLSVTPSFKKA